MKACKTITFGDLLFLIFFGTLIPFYMGSENCPPVEDINPCYCRKFCDSDYCSSQVQCHDIETVEAFNIVVERTSHFLFKDLLLQDSCIMYIPAQAVEAKRTEKLYIRGGCLSGIFDRAPVTSYLRELYIQNTVIQRAIQWSLLSNTSLVEMSVRDSKIQRFSRHFGKKLPTTVKRLFFEGTGSRYIAKGAFDGLDNLQSLVIARAFIKQLNNDMFPRPWNISSLSIVDNLLEVLPDDIFKYMPKIQDISFNNNNLSSISQNVFDGIFPQLNLLDFGGNPTVCDCAAEWLATKVNKPSIFIGECFEPPHLEGKELKHLKLEDFRPC